MNHFKKMGRALNERGIRAIPGRYMSKAALLKGWGKYFETKPTEEEIKEWEQLEKANVDILLGECSGIIGLDLDTTNPEILDLFDKLDILPKSPVEKVGSKGWTRFFKYKGIKTERLSFNGETVLEILSDGKKTTLGTHPNGSDYKYTSDKTLLDIDIAELPVLPPGLIQSLELTLKNKFGDASSAEYGKVISGRNDALTNHLTDMVNRHHTVDEVIQSLIQYDEEYNEPPLFTDPNEQRHTEPYTNALQFYANHITSFNFKRMRENKEYIVPVMESVSKVEEQQGREAGKSISEGSQRKPKQDYLVAPTVLKNTVETILKNSWIEQPDLAFGASLALISVLTARKFVYQGISPNLYILNVSESGSGKNAPLEFVKNTLAQLDASNLMGAGDYVSDASLMDSLPSKPVRLDIMDEMGGILNKVSHGKQEYNSKMADILAELYTSSHSYYAGRAMASGFGSNGDINIRGACRRPNVSILGATTPTGFEEGVTQKSIDKGLLGRFLFFTGDSSKSSQRVKNKAPLSPEDINHLSWLANFEPPESGMRLNGVNERFVELDATPEADKLLDEVFYEMDNRRLDTMGTTVGPITARLYQQMIKLVIIHAASRCYRQIPTIDVVDVEFGRNVINSFADEIEEVVNRLVFSSPAERDRHKMLDIIKKSGKIYKKELVRKTPRLNRRRRDDMLEELLEAGQVAVDYEKIDGRSEVFYVCL